jgi:hypothetical protein
MVAVPIVEESSGGAAGAMIAELAGLTSAPVEKAQIEVATGGAAERRLAIYPASAGFDLVEELDFLCRRTIEPNIFFNPRFLAPAMPRLEDREVRLAVIRDGDEYKTRLRMLMPFSIEKPAIPMGVPVIRTWSSPWGPLGTPLVDRDDPAGVVDDFLRIMARPHLRLPKVLVLPDMLLDGAAAKTLQSVTETRNLPFERVGLTSRAFLQSDLEGEAYLRNALRSHHYREFRRLWRKLAEKGALEHRIARAPEEIRHATEAFLALEASGWKGRERTAMAIDRFRAAFAREAIDRLSEQDCCRIHELVLDGRIVASLIVFIEAGVAYTWKTAYDENFSAYSPGTLLMIEVTKYHLSDPNIVATDSCAVPDHPVMTRLWTERRPVGTLVIGLTPGSDRTVRLASQQLSFYRETRNFARVLRNRVRTLLGRK